MKQLLVFTISLFFAMPCAAKVHPFSRLRLSDFNEKSIMKLSAMYGYARYFYPNPHLDKINWQFFLEDNIKELLKLTDEQEVNAFLLKEFSILIPQLTFSPEALSTTTPPITGAFYVKENTMNTGFKETPVISKIKKISKADTICPVPDRMYSFLLYDSLYASFPLALYELPPEMPEIKQAISESKRKWKKNFYVSPYFRMANAIINNTVIQHFYAYYEEDGLNLNWLKSFKTYLGQIANCASYREYLEYTYLHYALMKDSHVFIMNGYDRPNTLIGRFCPIYYPDIAIRHIEGKICIVDYASSYKSLHIGDEIVSVNGVPVEVLIEQKSKFISASTEASLFDKLCDMFLLQSFTKDSILRLEIKRDGLVIGEIPVVANKQEMGYPEHKNFITQTEEGIWLIDFEAYENANYKTFTAHIDQIQKAKGLILDLRCVPHTSIYPILSHFIDSAATVGVILTPAYYYPNHINVKYEIAPNSKWAIYPSTDENEYEERAEFGNPVPVRIHTPVVLLTDSRTLSRGDTYAEIVKHFKIGTIVGGHTSGTNGDATLVRTPAVGYVFTCYKFFEHDGKEHHGIGIYPDIECPMKIEDIRKGEDTQIKKACEIIHKLSDKF